MNIVLIFAALFACGWLSWFATRSFVFFALEQNVMDVPNHRSSHIIPTPRGGGISFAAVFLCAVGALGMLHLLSGAELLGVLSGLPIALIGFWDDWSSLSIPSRLATHLFLSGVALLCFFGKVLLPTAHLHSFGILLLSAAGVLAFTWLINLTNFMDGIDGITSVQTISAAGICSLIIITRWGYDEVALLFALLAAAVAGFLLWNWPPARIFMGDAGSGFLGYSFGSLGLLGVSRHRISIWAPLILFGVFVLDASITLLKRMWRGEEWYRPHTMHAFQHAAKRIGHRNTTAAVAVINGLWLAPWAFLAEWHPAKGLLCIIFAWLPLTILIQKLHAGEPRELEGEFHESIPLLTTIGADRRVAAAAFWIESGLTRVRRSHVLFTILKFGTLAAVSYGCILLARLTTQEFGGGAMAPWLVWRRDLPWVGTELAILALFRVHRSQWHLLSLEELPSLAGISLVCSLSGAFAEIKAMHHVQIAPASSVILLNAVFLVVGLTGLHLLAYLIRGMSACRRVVRGKRVLIYGANEAGVSIVSALRNLYPNHNPIGFVDANGSIKGTFLAGLQVLGGLSDLGRFARIYKVDEILAAAPHMHIADTADLLKSCTKNRIPLRMVNSIHEDLGLASRVEEDWLELPRVNSSVASKPQPANVLVVGPAAGRGGIASVIRLHQQAPVWNAMNCRLLSTWDDRSRVRKVGAAVEAYLSAPFRILSADVVHVHAAGELSALRKLPIVALARLMGRPVLVHVHAFSEESLFVKTPFAAGRIMLRTATQVIALSESWADLIRRHLPDVDVVVVPNPVPIREPRLQDRSSAAKILFVGRLEPRKGYRDLLNAAAEVLREFPDARLTMAGHGELQEARQLAGRLGVVNKLDLPGWVSGAALEELYRSATLLCLPSFDEGLPMCVLEAMSYGLPVVCTPVGGVPELVVNGVNGILVRPGDVASIRDGLMTVLRNPQKARNLGLKAAATVQEKYSLEVVSDRLEMIYRDLLTKPDATSSVAEVNLEVLR